MINLHGEMILKYIFYIIVAILLFDFVKFLYYKNLGLDKISIQNEYILGGGNDLTYIAAGDSTALGIGASSEKETYAYIIAENLASQKRVIYKNLGVSGAQTKDIIKTQLAPIINSNPQIVTISIGANDATHLKSASSIINNYLTIKNELLNKTDADIYISNIPSLSNARLLPIWFRKLLELKIIKINREINALESDRFNIVDIYASIPYTPETYARDRFHPSDKGYKNWAKSYLDLISN